MRAYEAALAIQQKQADANPRVVEFQHDLATVHNNIGTLLRASGRPDEASKSFARALPIRERLAREHPDLPDDASAVGSLLNNMAQLDIDAQRFDEARARLQTAIEWQRKALAVNPRHPTYREFLGNHLKNLLLTLRAMSRDEEAAKVQQELEAFDATDPQFAALDARLAAVLNGEAPKDNAERLALAQRAYDRGLVAAAARLWSEALQADPGLAADRQAQHRYNAACAAVLAGSGKGRDDPPPDDAARARLRDQARAWLEAELVVWEGLLKSGPDAARAGVVETLRHWQADADLATVRDAAPLAALPASERAAWRGLWDKVASLLGNAKAPPAGAR
jgi:tetratricopeptide (TPR) repeat protein